MLVKQNSVVNEVYVFSYNGKKRVAFVLNEDDSHLSTWDFTSNGHRCFLKKYIDFLTPAPYTKMSFNEFDTSRVPDGVRYYESPTDVYMVKFQ